MANDTAVPLNRIERVLAFMIGSVAAVSILAIVAVLVANLSGATLGDGLWPAVSLLPFVGLPLAFVLIVVFLVVSTTRRRRLGRDAR